MLGPPSQGVWGVLNTALLIAVLIFLLKFLKIFFIFGGIATSRTTPYPPTGNSQNEHWNQTIWRTIKLMLHSRRIPEEALKNVLQDALHSTKSFLCTSMNLTPQDRFFQFHCRSSLENLYQAGL